MTPPLYDWSRVVFAGDWDADEAEAFVRRVEEIHDEELERAAVARKDIEVIQ